MVGKVARLDFLYYNGRVGEGSCGEMEALSM